MNKKSSILGGITFLFFLFIASFLIGNYLGREKMGETQTDSLPTPNGIQLADNEGIIEDGNDNGGLENEINEEIIGEETINSVSVSEAAERIGKGMTYQEVVQIMGRLPDTVVTDEIRQELGELPNGYGEINFEWLNDKSGCLPITIIFDSSTVKVVDIGGYNACFPNAPIEVFGKPCVQTNLCDVTVNTRQNN